MYRSHQRVLQLGAVFSLLLAGFGGWGCRGASSSSDVNVVGGKETDEDPAVVAIYVEIMAREARFMCTGTLIAPDLVLTAAHCLEQPRLNFMHVHRVFSGSDLRDKSKRPKAYTGYVERIDTAFDYTDPAAGHDIGVLRLTEPMPIKPIPYLKTALTQEAVGKKVRVVGFGESSAILDSGSEVKRTATLKIESLDDKVVKVGGFFHNVCRGDSGGPILLNMDGVETVIGVNSYGSAFCRQSAAGTRVDVYREKVIDPSFAPKAQ